MATWRIKPGLSHTHHGKKLVGGDEMEASEFTVRGFRDKLELVEADDVPETKLKVVKRVGGWYDVVNPDSGKTLNATKLRLAAANALAGIAEEET